MKQQAADLASDIDVESRQKILDSLEPFAEAALIHEAMSKRGALDACITPAFPGAHVYGFALTVQGLPGDNLMLHKAISVARPGDVIVADVGGYLEAGVWGEICSVASIERGVRGFVTNGAVRDVNAISTLGFPMFSCGRSIKGTTKRQAGKINQPIVLGNIKIHPDDFIIGDADGVVVIPHDELDQTLKAAQTIKTHEAGIIDRLRNGELTIDILKMQSALEECGLGG